MNNKNKFIYTVDNETAIRLKNCGFTLINENNGSWTFLNDSSLLLPNSINRTKMAYTNILCF